MTGVDSDIGKANTVSTVRDSQVSLAGICRFTILTFLENLNVQIPVQSPNHVDPLGPNPSSAPLFDPSNIATVIATYLHMNESSDVVQIPESILFPMPITDEGQTSYDYALCFYIFCDLQSCVSGCVCMLT
jgi:hypothetical protein